MGKIRKMCRNLSLRKSIVLYIAVFAFIGVLLSAWTASTCNIIRTRIEASYPVSGERYYLTTADGEQLGEGTYISKQETPMRERDERFLFLLEIVPVFATPIYSALCVIAAALLFYRDKLKAPLAELKAASVKISNNDLDFRVNYRSEDEMGQLCASFERMRFTLAGNFSGMWRQMEERKQLNAAFAHDLRTPLTVLKGYDELLQMSADDRTKETALTMGNHISRMERYVDSMSRLQRLEDVVPNYEVAALQEFLASLAESCGLLCEQNGKKCRIENDTHSDTKRLDPYFVSQVCSNLLSNAVRYASSAVTLSFAETQDGLRLTVTDDGKGFSKDTLSKAVNPYFTEEEKRSEHFGLGLYICKLLCERHSGELKLENAADGARVTAFFGVR